MIFLEKPTFTAKRERVLVVASSSFDITRFFMKHLPCVTVDFLAFTRNKDVHLMVSSFLCAVTSALDVALPVQCPAFAQHFFLVVLPSILWKLFFALLFRSCRPAPYLEELQLS